MSDFNKTLSIFLASFMTMAITYFASIGFKFDDGTAYLYGLISFNITFFIFYFTVLSKSGSIYPTIKFRYFAKNKLAIARGISASIYVFVIIVVAASLLIGAKINVSFHFSLAPSIFLLCQVLFEETFFTGVVLNSLRKKFGVSISVMITACIFALCHFSTSLYVSKIVTYLLFSSLMCVWAVYYQNLLPGIIFHTLVDFLRGAHINTGPATISVDPIIILSGENKLSYIYLITTVLFLILVYYIGVRKALNLTK